jgi:hypothetical protein
MADRDRNVSSDTKSGTTAEKDFGRTDRYANQDKDNKQNVNFTTTGDGTAWDSGRGSSITNGTRLENDVREADAEAPGVSGPKPNREGE